MSDNRYVVSLFNLFRKKEYRIGFVLAQRLIQLYKTIMASTRFRAYDPIFHLYGHPDYLLEVYNRFRTYDMVIFQKVFTAEALELAKALRQKGTRIVFDINVNYFDNSSDRITPEQKQRVFAFIREVDYIICPTLYLKEYIAQFFDNDKIFVIEENILNPGIRKRLDEPGLRDEPVRLVWSGALSKESDVMLIKGQIEKLAQERLIELYVYTGKVVDLPFDSKNVKIISKKFDPGTIFYDFLKGDIFIAPRDLKDAYNLGHAFTKIGFPMSAGLPVIASPVPSYENSPAILIDNFGDQWSQEIMKLYGDVSYYNRLSREGADFCQRNYSKEKIAGDYVKFFDTLLKKQQH